MELQNIHCLNCGGTGKIWSGDYLITCLNCEGRGFLKLTLEQINELNKKSENERLERIAWLKENERKNKGCFIATVCYGNYDASEVITLRQFRDDKLIKTLVGRLFVNIYYLVAPFLVILISKSDILKKTIRQYILNPIVIKLKHSKK